MSIEVNGPSNILMLIDMHRAMTIGHPVRPEDKALLDHIRQEATFTLQYLRQLENPKGVKWTDIKKENENAE
jgi:hypothetical protein